MAALLPLIQDLLPMIMPSSIHITRADELRPALDSTAAALDPAATVAAASPEIDAAAPAATDRLTLPRILRPGAGVISRGAIVNKTDKMCASLMTAKPMSSSAVFHNGEQDAIIYAVSGTSVLATHSGDDESPVSRHDISAGDFAFVPCWTEHQLLNNSDEEVVWVVVRSGSSPTMVELTEWGGPEVKRARDG